jgi:2-polyprenyl-3-methyl-5-hydroxy-6-metoxy-1,4-benzoquinol methylase
MKSTLVVVSTCFRPSSPDRCRQSVAAQTLPVQHVFIEAASQPTPKTHSENLRDAVLGLDPDAVVLQLDGDDWLAHPDVASQIADIYEDPDVWLTYGSFATVDGRYHETNAPYAPDEDVRATAWRCSHLKTFRAGLFQRIDPADLKLEDGAWTGRAVDHATMFPMVEMAGWDRTRWVEDVLYVYGESGTDPALGALTASAAQFFRSKRRYPRLSTYRRSPRDLDAIYDARFFEAYQGLQRVDIRTAAESAFRLFSPRRALDVGAGPGQFVGRLREFGVDAWGLDGSAAAFDRADKDVLPFLWQEDITAGFEVSFGTLGATPYDLVSCMEVAEHVPAEFADTLVRRLCKSCATGGAIMFTAAPPGQGGHDHINCQPPAYWIAKFGAEGFSVDEAGTTVMKAEWMKIVRMPWYGQNVLIFRSA